LKIVLDSHLSTTGQKAASGAVVLYAKKVKCCWIIFANKISGNRHFADLFKQFKKGSFFEQAERRLFI
jgi:hypothetical protein